MVRLGVGRQMSYVWAYVWGRCPTFKFVNIPHQLQMLRRRSPMHCQQSDVGVDAYGRDFFFISLSAVTVATSVLSA